MSKFISTALFASLVGKAVSQDVTATAWLPGMQDSGITYVGSVVSASGDTSVMVLDYTNLPSSLSDLSAQGPQTVTMGGATFLDYQADITQSGIVATISAACSRSNTDDAEAVCTMSTMGLDDTLSSISSICAGSESEDEFCSSAMAIQTETTDTLPQDYFGTFMVIVTAGGDLLPSPASAAATPTDSAASATGSSMSRVTSTASASGSQSDSASASASKSSAASSSAAAQQSTAGAPMMTMAPAVAALGAAAAFFL